MTIKTGIKLLTVNITEYATSTESFPIKKGFQEFKNNPFFKLVLGNREGEYSVESRQFVGSFFHEGIAININPKAGNLNFLRMLLEGDDEASIRLSDSLLNEIEHSSIVEILAMSLANEILNLKTIGFKNDYVERSDNLRFLRGSINVYANVIHNHSDQTKLFCNFTEYTKDIPLNQALKWAIETLRLNLNLGFNEMVYSASKVMAEVTMPGACPVIEEAACLPEYKKAIRLVNWVREFVIVGQGGNNNSGQGLFVDMNKVFEGFVRERLRRVCHENHFIIRDKKYFSTKLCRGVRLEPDIIISNQADQKIAVLDCKYKINWHYKNNDVYQMLAYLESMPQIKNAYILYPSDAYILGDHIDLPRGRRLHKIGIPQSKYFDDDFWREIFTRLELSGLAVA